MAYNNSLHKSIGMSPFRANYGFNPDCNIDAPPVLLKDNASVLTRDWSAHFDAFRVLLLKQKKTSKNILILEKLSALPSKLVTLFG